MTHVKTLHEVVEVLVLMGPPELRPEDIARLRRAMAAVEASIPDDIRDAGWAVAVHNDYQLNGERHTFWLFTKGSRCVKGEGRTDEEALNIVRATLYRDGW